MYICTVVCTYVWMYLYDWFCHGVYVKKFSCTMTLMGSRYVARSFMFEYRLVDKFVDNICHHLCLLTL